MTYDSKYYEHWVKFSYDIDSRELTGGGYGKR